MGSFTIIALIHLLEFFSIVFINLFKLLKAFSL